MKYEFISIKKNNKYYLRHKTDNHFDFRDFVFNSKSFESFSQYWKVFEILPTRIHIKYPSCQKVVGYNLKPGFAVSELTPAKLPADSFEYLGDEEYKNDTIRGLYAPEYEILPERFTDVEFTIEIIDEDCEPLTDPKYKVITDFPHFIDNHESVWHKYPCHINSQELFNIIRTFVKNNLPDHCVVTSDYDFSFCVELKVPLLHEETYQKNVAGFRATKPKYKTVPLRSIQFKIIDIGVQNEKYGEVKIKSLSGSNYKDLENKIDIILNEYKNKMSQKLAVCPNCKGYGFQIDKS